MQAIKAKRKQKGFFVLLQIGLLGGMSFFAPHAVAARYYTPENVRTLYTYAGLDIQGRHTLIREKANESNIPSKIFKKNYWGWDGFLGSRFLNNWALEFGIFRSQRNDRTYKTVSGDILLGDPEPVGSDIYTAARFQGVHLDLFGIFPHRNVEERIIELLGSVGVAYTKTTLKVVINSLNLTTKPKRDVLPRIGLGFQWWVSTDVGVRAMVRYVLTSKIKTKIYHDNTRRLENFKPFNNSIVVNLGVFMAL